jgi:hypothetical protein
MDVKNYLRPHLHLRLARTYSRTLLLRGRPAAGRKIPGRRTKRLRRIRRNYYVNVTLGQFFRGGWHEIPLGDISVPRQCSF